MALQWPELVTILDPECGHELTDKPGASKDNKPHSPRGWAEEEFRGKGIPSSQVDIMLGIWLYRFDCLLEYRLKSNGGYSNYDHYNAAWVACGYTEGQSAKALELARRRFRCEPDGQVMDDPTVKRVRKKVAVKA